jgi:hypothetical protein
MYALYQKITYDRSNHVIGNTKAIGHRLDFG